MLYSLVAVSSTATRRCFRNSLQFYSFWLPREGLQRGRWSFATQESGMTEEKIRIEFINQKLGHKRINLRHQCDAYKTGSAKDYARTGDYPELPANCSTVTWKDANRVRSS